LHQGQGCDAGSPQVQGAEHPARGHQTQDHEYNYNTRAVVLYRECETGDTAPGVARERGGQGRIGPDRHYHPVDNGQGEFGPVDQQLRQISTELDVYTDASTS